MVSENLHHLTGRYRGYAGAGWSSLTGKDVRQIGRQQGVAGQVFETLPGKARLTKKKGLL